MRINKKLRSINRRIVVILLLTESIIFMALIITVLLNVFCRYILRTPLFWANELACDMLVYLVLIGTSLALYYDKHVGLNFKIGQKHSAFIGVAHGVKTACIWGFLIVSAVVGAKLFWENRNSLTGTILIPSGYVYLSVPISAVISMPLYMEKCLSEREKAR